jgi:integrase
MPAMLHGSRFPRGQRATGFGNMPTPDTKPALPVEAVTDYLEADHRLGPEPAGHRVGYCIARSSGLTGYCSAYNFYSCLAKPSPACPSGRKRKSRVTSVVPIRVRLLLILEEVAASKDFVIRAHALRRPRDTSKPRSLTVDEFQRFVHHLGKPFHTTALVCVWFGLRISEALALRWSDVDWLNGKLSV